MHDGTVVGSLVTGFALCLFGGQRLAHRIGRHGRLLVFEQQWRPGFAQMPFDVVGKHRQQDMCAYTSFKIVANRLDFQIDAFERAKSALHARELFV